MGKYIEVGRILEFYDAEINALNSTFGEIGGEAGAYVECLKDVRSEIERFPTADVAPVAHGQWLGKSGPFQCKCSVCGWMSFEKTTDWVRSYWTYCPNCGAKMDLEETDNG